MKVLFVINPRSGKGIGPDIEALIRKQAEGDGFDYQIHTLGLAPDEEVQEKIKNYQPNIVMAAGGDGTLSFLANLLANTHIALAVIPLGSANGMARELGISQRPDFALSLLKKGIQKPIDLLQINQKSCLHLADVGLNARIVKRFEQDTRRGIWTYARHLFDEIFLMKTYTFLISCDEKMFKRKAVSLTFANASQYGTGAVINPHGQIDDGKFELVILKPFPKIELFSIAWKMFRHNLHTSDYVEVFSCSKAHVICSRKTTLQIDGEIIGKVKEFEIGIMPQSLNMLIPPESK